MNKFLIFFLLSILPCFAQESLKISYHNIPQFLDQYSQSYADLMSREYIAKQKIQYARASLLPKLNLWRLSSLLIDWRAAGELLAQDVFPFFVPANWIKIKEEKLMSEIIHWGNIAMRKNIQLQTKSLILQYLQDEQHYHFIKNLIQDYADMEATLKERSQFELQLLQVLKKIQYQRLLLEEDLLEVQKILEEEKRQITYVFNQSPSTIIEVSLDEELYSLDRLKNKIQDLTWERVSLNSAEVHQMNKVLELAPLVKKTLLLSLFGLPENYAQTGAGYYDLVPVQNGLGFGLGPSLKIQREQLTILENQKRTLELSLKNQISYMYQSIDHWSSMLDKTDQKLQLLNQLDQDMSLQYQMTHQMDWLSLVEIKLQQMNTQLQKNALMFKLHLEYEKCLSLVP